MSQGNAIVLLSTKLKYYNLTTVDIRTLYTPTLVYFSVCMLFFGIHKGNDDKFIMFCKKVIHQYK